MTRWKPTDPRLSLLGYSFADLLVLTDATKSDLQHWTKTGIIKAAIADGSGRGHHRRFSSFNVIQVQLAATINQRLRVPAEMIRGAVRIFTNFHIGAVAVYERDAKVALHDTRWSPFSTEAARERAVQHFAHTVRNEILINANRHDMAGEDAADAASHAEIKAIAKAWALVRTGSLPKGIPDPSLRSDIVMFLATTEPLWAQVVLNPSTDDIRRLLEDIVVLIDLPAVVYRVGEHCERLGGFPLGAW